MIVHGQGKLVGDEFMKNCHLHLVKYLRTVKVAYEATIEAWGHGFKGMAPIRWHVIEHLTARFNAKGDVFVEGDFIDERWICTYLCTYAHEAGIKLPTQFHQCNHKAYEALTLLTALEDNTIDITPTDTPAPQLDK